MSSETPDERSSPTSIGKSAFPCLFPNELAADFLCLFRSSRQETAGSAHLTPDEHDRLVATLSALERDPDYYKKVDVYVVKQESLDRRAMLQLLMKTDVSSSLSFFGVSKLVPDALFAILSQVLLSVRTPQQSHQLWMKPGSAIFEFFEPGHYTRESFSLSFSSRAFFASSISLTLKSPWLSFPDDSEMVSLKPSLIQLPATRF